MMVPLKPQVSECCWWTHIHGIPPELCRLDVPLMAEMSRLVQGALLLLAPLTRPRAGLVDHPMGIWDLRQTRPRKKTTLEKKPCAK